MMNVKGFRPSTIHCLLSTLLVLLISLAVCCGCPWAAEPQVETILPEQGFFEGWARSGTIKSYGADNLYTYINGEAEMYMPFGFQGLGTALYVKTGNPDTALVVDIYKMGSPLDAFGIYSYYRDPEAEDARIGSEGFVDESQLMFYKDRYFVRLSASGSSNPEPAVFIGCAKAIAGRIPGETSRPKELEILKVPGITPRTEKYAALSVMGYAFFKRGLTAEAVLNGRPAKVFVVIDESEQASDNSLESYIKYLKEKGVKPETGNSKEGPTLVSQDPLYKGVIVRQAGRYLLGVAGLADPRDAAPLIARIQFQSRTAKP
jgi:hypothetical protein